MSIEIISVELKIDEKFVKLEAKELKEFLAGAFQNPIYPVYPYTWWTSPSIPSGWDGHTTNTDKYSTTQTGSDLRDRQL